MKAIVCTCEASSEATVASGGACGVFGLRIVMSTGTWVEMNWLTMAPSVKEERMKKMCLRVLAAREEHGRGGVDSRGHRRRFDRECLTTTL